MEGKRQTPAPWQAMSEEKDNHMTKLKTNTRPSPEPSKPKSNTLTVPVCQGENADEIAAKVLMGPFVSNAFSATLFGKATMGELALDDAVTALVKSAKSVKDNDLSQIEETLTAQAMTLNIMFGELARRSALNMGEYIEASQRYMNMALKAQNQCRMTLETLSAIKNPPVVYARQANIAHGPQQVNNGTATATHAGENANRPNKLLEQGNERPLDTGTPGNTSDSHQALETVGGGNRTENR
jgi:hypothetical protein